MKGFDFRLSMALLTGCEDNQQYAEPVKENAGPGSARNAVKSEDAINEELFDHVAKLLALSLKDKQVGRLLKTEVGKKFDGDYDVLYDRVKELSVGNEPLEKRLSKVSAGILGSTVPDLLLDLRNKTKSVDILNISIPVNSNGNVHWLSAKDAPTNPIIVVGINERVSPKKKSKGARTSNESDDQIDGGDGGGGGGGYCGDCEGPSVYYDPSLQIYAGPPPVSACRQNRYYEYLTAINCVRLRDYESWWKGAPELVLRVFSPAQSNRVIYSPGIIEPPTDNDVMNTWWSKQLLLFQWNYEAIGDAVHFLWLERDPSTRSQKITISSKVTTPSNATTGTPGTETTVNTEYNVGKDDLELGQNDVYFTDCAEVVDYYWFKFKIEKSATVR